MIKYKYKVFTKNNCGGCTMLKPHLATALEDKDVPIKYYNIDEDESALDKARLYGVMSLPTIVKIPWDDSDEDIDMIVGFRHSSQLKKWIE